MDMHTMMFMPGTLGMILPIFSLFAGGIILLSSMRAVIRRNRRRHIQQNPEHGNRSRLEPAIYRLARNRGGRLTVSDVVIATGIPVGEAERILNEMVDGVRVTMNVRDNGVIVYEFTELMSETDGSGHEAHAEMRRGTARY